MMTCIALHANINSWEQDFIVWSLKNCTETPGITVK